MMKAVIFALRLLQLLENSATRKQSMFLLRDSMIVVGLREGEYVMRRQIALKKSVQKRHWRQFNGGAICNLWCGMIETI
jgi:hypothetical protein